MLILNPVVLLGCLLAVNGAGVIVYLRGRKRTPGARSARRVSAAPAFDPLIAAVEQLEQRYGNPGGGRFSPVAAAACRPRTGTAPVS